MEIGDKVLIIKDFSRNVIKGEYILISKTIYGGRHRFIINNTTHYGIQEYEFGTFSPDEYITTLSEIRNDKLENLINDL